MALREKRDTRETEGKVIEINAKMQGTLSFKDPVNLQINGRFEGTLETRGVLTVGNTASVAAHITGEEIIIAGKVRGDITAKRAIILLPTASLNGNIVTPKLTVAEGAIFQGRCQMLDEAMDMDALAKYLEIETSAIVELANSGQIPATKEGNSWRFERSRIDEWASSAQIK